MSAYLEIIREIKKRQSLRYEKNEFKKLSPPRGRADGDNHNLRSAGPGCDLLADALDELRGSPYPLGRHERNTLELPDGVAPPSATAPVTLRDGRVMHRFRAGEIPASPSPETEALLDRVRRIGVVLVGDGMELHVVERRKGQMHPNMLRALFDNAGDVIAALRGEHRERVARLPAECVAVSEGDACFEPRY
jgi:hypothetical protein